MKKIAVLYLLILFSSIYGCKKNDDPFQSLDLLDKLNYLDGVSAIEISPSNGYPRAFQIDITQPVDHNNPDGAQFTQRVYLSHVDESMPMIFAPSGYASSPTSGQELAYIMGTNCLNVTHRYFINAQPSPLDWQYLTIEQAAADHHRIVELFKRIYKNKWISSGASKSGLTALFHRRFYPDDVDATVAYVAPFIFGPKDMRYATYLEQIGESGCYTKLEDFQRLVLQNRAEITPMVDSYIASSGQSYSLNHELILELMIMDYPFTFWQYYNYSCAEIPDATNTAQEMFSHLISVVPVSNFSDANNTYFQPYVYQAMTEMGAPGYKTSQISDLLENIDPNDAGNPNFELLGPEGVTYTFNSNTINDIYSWLQTQGNNIIYIYGANDPWSAGAIELTGATNAIKIMQTGENHGVKIGDLDNPSLVYNALEEWLGISIQNNIKKLSVSELNEPLGFRLNY